MVEVEHLLAEDHPINTRIEKLYHLDNSDYAKPDPRVFTKILADFSVTNEETVYVGDSITDGLAAKGAGLHFIAVMESGLRTKDDFSHIPVDHFADTFPEILQYIK